MTAPTTSELIEEAFERKDEIAQIPACIIANIEAVPGWQDSDALVTARAHAMVLHEDIADRLAELERERDKLSAEYTDLKVFDTEEMGRLLSRATAAERSLTEAEGLIEVVLSADREALANHRPKWGIADCIDNDGVAYQSQYLGDALAKARAYLAKSSAKQTEGDRSRDEPNTFLNPPRDTGEET